MKSLEGVVSGLRVSLFNLLSVLIDTDWIIILYLNTYFFILCSSFCVSWIPLLDFRISLFISFLVLSFAIL